MVVADRVMAAVAMCVVAVNVAVVVAMVTVRGKVGGERCRLFWTCLRCSGVRDRNVCTCT